jgi:CRP/FNR family transcriptional regulator
LHSANTESGLAAELVRTPILLHSRPGWNEASAEWRAGEFYKGFSPAEIAELESIATPYCCPGTTVLFAEEQEAYNVLFLLEGKVKLTMNSSGGRRLTLGIATPGDVLGLSAVVSGRPYEITAVAQFPCRIRALPRKIFLDLLLHNPIAWQNSARQLGAEYKRGCEQLRILGFALTASMKLAMLLLQWSAKGQREGLGVRLHCSFTHEEIGEYIGVSRETISRSLIKFKSLHLVEQHGSVFLIPRLRALEVYVGQYGW